MYKFRTFREYTSDRDQYEMAKDAILNALGATEDAMQDPLANFKDARDLTDSAKNPALVDIINNQSNKDSIIMAIKNARNTKISLADLLALFAAGESGNNNSVSKPNPQEI